MESAGTQNKPRPPPRPSNSTKPKLNATPSDKARPPPPPRPRGSKPRGVQFKDQKTSTRAEAATEKERETKPKMTSSGIQTRETGPKRGREERTEGRRENRRHDREESGHHKREDSLDKDRERRRDRDSTRDTDVRDSDTEREHQKEDSKGLFGKIFNRSGKGSDKSETDRPRTGDRSRTSRYRQPRGRGEDASPSHLTSSEKKKAAADAARERAEKVHGSANDEGTDHGTRSSRRRRETGQHGGHDSNASTRRDRDGHRGGRDESPHSTRRGHDSTARRRQSADSGAESRGVHPSHKSDKSRRVSRVLHEQYSYNMDVEFDPREFTYGEKCSCCDQEKPFLKLPVPADVIRSLWEDGLFD